VVEYLVHQGAEINTETKIYPYGTPLHYAAQNGYLNIVQYLVNQKTNIRAKNWFIVF